MHTLCRLLTLAAALFPCACTAPLEYEPWSQVGAGTASFGASTGYAFYEAEIEAEGTSGVLAPGGVPETGTDTTTLTPRYGGALKASYFPVDWASLGLIYEYRSFDADPVSPLDAELQPESFVTQHFLASLRLWPDVAWASGRLKPFVGLDVGYVPGVTFEDVTVVYPGDIPSEQIDVDGDAFWTLAPVVGASYLLQDRLSLDFGAFYEFSFEPSDATLTLPNLGGATADVQVWPDGVILFVGLTKYL